LPGWLRFRFGFRLRRCFDDLVGFVDLVVFDLVGLGRRLCLLRLDTPGRLEKAFVDLQLVEAFVDARGGTREENLNRRHLTRTGWLPVDFEQSTTFFATGTLDL